MCYNRANGARDYRWVVDLVIERDRVCEREQFIHTNASNADRFGCAPRDGNGDAIHIRKFIWHPACCSQPNLYRERYHYTDGLGTGGFSAWHFDRGSGLAAPTR